jgi:hypothetical protein
MESEIFTLEIKDQDVPLKLDLLWLRDSCRCELCYDQTTFQRKVSILNISDDIAIKNRLFENDVLKIVCK